jgi:hypothetical protein
MSNQDNSGSDGGHHDTETETQVGSSLEGTTEVGTRSPAPTLSMVPSEGTQSVDSDESWGNTGPGPWDDENVSDGENSRREVRAAISRTEVENPGLLETVISSGDRAQAKRARPSTGDEEDEGGEGRN